MNRDVWCCARRPMTWALLVSACVGLSGCGGPPSGQLTGKVTDNGNPVSGAELEFASTTNPDDLFRGSSGSDGTYAIDYRALEGMPPGTYKVTVRHYTLPGGKPLPQGEEAEGFDYIGEGKAVLRSAVFDQAVSDGSNEIDFELTKGRKPGS